MSSTTDSTRVDPLRQRAEQIFDALEIVLLGKPGNTFERGRLETALQTIERELQAVREEATRAERERWEAKIEKFRLYSEWGARHATGATYQNNTNYNPADLCRTQTDAIRQLQEYLDPQCDGYLIALVEDGAKRAASDPGEGTHEAEEGAKP